MMLFERAPAEGEPATRSILPQDRARPGARCRERDTPGHHAPSSPLRDHPCPGSEGALELPMLMNTLSKLMVLTIVANGG